MSRKLKIALLVKEFSRTGGMERYVVELARRLRDRGHEIHLYSRKINPELLEGLYFYEVPSRYTYSSVLRALAFAHDTAKMLDRRFYDIVHSHERGYCQDILTLHCFSYRQGMSQYSWLRRLDQQYLSLRSHLYLWLERRQMKSPWLVAVSGAIAADVREQYGRSANVVVIPPGVDTEVFRQEAIIAMRQEARERQGIAADELVVLFVGSEFRRKGLDRLIPAISPGMRLLVVGQGDAWRYHTNLVAHYGVEARVCFMGLVSDVLQYYAAADVVVLPSRSEAFGMSILEGMACGLPVIASATSGVASLIRHGENGYLMYDPAELPLLLRQLFVSEERERLGRAARATAEEHSWDEVTTMHEELYRQCIALRC